MTGAARQRAMGHTADSMARTPFVVQLLHHLADDLAHRLHGLYVVLRLLVVALEVLQREPHCPRASAPAAAPRRSPRTVLQALPHLLVLPHFLAGTLSSRFAGRLRLQHILIDTPQGPPFAAHPAGPKMLKLVRLTWWLA